MGGFFGTVSRRDTVLDIFFGTDYHSHLGTRTAGMAVWDAENGCRRQIHSIANSPFRTRFENDLHEFSGGCGIGCISDTDPQPLLVRSKLGLYAIATVGVINNAEELVSKCFSEYSLQLMANSSGSVNSCELTAALINEAASLTEGIKRAQSLIDGSLTVLLMTGPDEIIAARDRLGRLPVMIGRDEDGYCVSFESFAAHKLGYQDAYELGPGVIVSIRPDGIKQLAPPGDKMKICAFLWTYYGYPNSRYEGKNVEIMRYLNGAGLARGDRENGGIPDVDFIAGMPDSGVPHAIGYSNEAKLPFARPFIKYTPTWPRSFMPASQAVRNQVAKMKQIPVPELIEGKKILLVDDSIVRGTQIRETADFLYECGASEVHMRSACPPIMYNCRFLNFSRNNADTDLLARRTIKELEGDEGDRHLDEYADEKTERGQCMLKRICEKIGFASLRYQSLDELLAAIGIDKDKVCTYCWTGKDL